MTKSWKDYIYYEEKNPDLYVLHGDCFEVMPLLHKVDLVVTDPPYGIGVDIDMHKKGGQQYGNAAAPKKHYEQSNWDIKPKDEIFSKIRSISKEQIIWGCNYFDLPPTRCMLVWDKENGANNFADCELAWTNLDKPVRIKRHMWNGMLRKQGEHRWSHPTQKPTSVIIWCISFLSDGLILDPFLGSGTTLVACKELNRSGIGIEINEKYCAIAKNRLQNTTKSLF